MKKRFLAALLSLCMTLTLLPTTAFAAVSDSRQHRGNQINSVGRPARHRDRTDEVFTVNVWVDDAAISRWIKPSRWTARC